MTDTIAAVATPPGEGGIGIVRLSGPGAEEILLRLFCPAGKPGRLESHRLYYGHVKDGAVTVDEGMAVVMRAPRSYTREDVAELQLHGGQAVLQTALRLCLREGARLAEPGEFTRRAFENGRIDLAQAEAVMALISARSEQARQAAVRQLEGGASAFIREAADELYRIQAAVAACIDYPEEVSEEEALADVQPRLAALSQHLEEAADEKAARILQNGLQVALCGRPNVGKSSLLNAVLREDRAIVTPVAGTTRDIVTGETILGGCLVRLTDTAGVRDTEDTVERLGVERAKKAMREADLLLLVLDASQQLTEEDRLLLEECAGQDAVILLNKGDLPQTVFAEDVSGYGLRVMNISASRPETLAPLRALLAEKARCADSLALTQPRHVEAARRAAAHLRSAAEAMNTAVDLCSVDLLAAQSALAEITGDAVEERLLDRVFEEFCVGK